METFLSGPDWANVIAEAARKFWIADDLWHSPHDRYTTFRSRLGPYVFANWIFFDFQFEPRRCIINAFLENASGLSAGELGYFRAMQGTALRLYEVTDLHVDESITLRELMSGDFVRVGVKGLRPTLRGPRWEWIAARIVLRGVSGYPELIGSTEILPFVGMSARDSTLVDELRKMHDELREVRPELDERERWGVISPRLFAAWCRWTSRPQPVISKADDRPLEMVAVYFDVVDPDRLASTLDGAGSFLRKATNVAGKWWTWIDPGRGLEGRESPPVPMGWVQLFHRCLILHANSLDRSTHGRGLLTKLAGQLLHHRETTRKTVSDEAATRQHIEDGQITADPPSERSNTALDEVENALIKYYQRWLDRELPEFDGKTPRQAANSPELRGSLVLLLKDLERDYETALAHDELAYDPTWIREQLNLDADLQAAGKPNRENPRAAHESRVEPMPSLRILANKIVEESRRQRSRDPSPFTRSDLHEITSGHFDLSVFNEKLMTWLETLCNFHCYGCRTFLFNQFTSAKLGVTEADFAGSDNLHGAPFPSFAVLFTDRSALRDAERIMCRDPHARLRSWVLQSVTAHITETKRGNARHLRIIFGCDALDGQQFPDLLLAELSFQPGATVHQILDGFGPVVIGGPVRRLVQIALHAIICLSTILSNPAS
jgi:hypothetical protein